MIKVYPFDVSTPEEYTTAIKRKEWVPPPCNYCDLGLTDLLCTCFDFKPSIILEEVVKDAKN